MLRLLRYFLIIKLLLAIVGVGYLYFTRVEKTEKLLSKKLNADVSIKDVKLRWKKVALQKIKISNSHSPLFRADEIEITFNPWELCKKEIHVNKIKIQNPIIGLMLFNKTGSENNWVSSLKQQSMSKKKFVIDTLKLMNLRFEAQFANGKGVTLPALSYVELHDLGKSSALTFMEVEREIFSKLAMKDSSLALYFGHLPSDQNAFVEEGLVDVVKRKGRSLVDGVRGLF